MAARGHDLLSLGNRRLCKNRTCSTICFSRGNAYAVRPSRTTPILILALAVFLLGIAPPSHPHRRLTSRISGRIASECDKFDWHIYESDHFEIYFYPEIEPHLERLTSYLESAYQRISSELRHELPERAKVVLFKTQSEFQQQDISGGELPEGVLAFAEPYRDRLVLPIDEPPDQLYPVDHA